MVGLYVEYDGYGRVECEEAVVVFAAFEYYRVPAADAVPGVQQRQRAAYHDGGVALRRHEDVGTHAGSGRLAVGPGYAQGV